MKCLYSWDLRCFDAGILRNYWAWSMIPKGKGRATVAMSRQRRTPTRFCPPTQRWSCPCRGCMQNQYKAMIERLPNEMPLFVGFSRLWCRYTLKLLNMIDDARREWRRRLLWADGVVHQHVFVLRHGDDLVPVGVVGNGPDLREKIPETHLIPNTKKSNIIRVVASQ